MAIEALEPRILGAWTAWAIRDALPTFAPVDRKAIELHRVRSVDRDPATRAPDCPRVDIQRLVEALNTGDEHAEKVKADVIAAWERGRNGIRLPDPDHPDFDEDPGLRSYVARLADGLRSRAESKRHE